MLIHFGSPAGATYDDDKPKPETASETEASK